MNVSAIESSAQGRLNQWAHLARAQGPGFFFLFEGPPTGCGEIIFFKLIAVNCLCNTKQTYSKGLFLCCAGIVADNGAINAANFCFLTFAKINCKGNPVNTF